MSQQKSLSRRAFLKRAAQPACASLMAVSLAACTTAGPPPAPPKPKGAPRYVSQYAAMPDEQFPLPAIDVSKIDPKFLRQQVDYPTGERVGSVIVDTNAFFLYLVQENGKAMRYGVGLGRAGFEWSGRARIAWKRKWPKWTPPDEMIAREPELEQWSVRNGGMPPGLMNPLGARALYIFEGNVDTLYRIHGSPEHWTIGQAVSSGCVRLMQQDVIDLYDRIPGQAPILVL